ncbi:unnamed protein product [Aspergillus oryzae var. brunneus]|uniref:Unnamed protein product n=1 Tax=Aspergillus oryzae var. brunneus TaxID=332754 RepID=A0ABQ6L111_ASPOZ|nr:unnamed protein product [Aspergillus oryzae]GMG48634.1 unnamed protein product [Aspergillus oryzae var. brunneus]
MSQLNKWMMGGKISKLVVVITDKETGEHVERYSGNTARAQSLGLPVIKKTLAQSMPTLSITHIHQLIACRNADTQASVEKTEKEIQEEIQAIFRQITASVTFLPVLDGDCTFNVLVYADADSEVPVEWGDSDAKEIKNAEKVQLRSFSTNNHRVETLVSYRLAD